MQDRHVLFPGVPGDRRVARSRGRWNREDRRTVPAEILHDLYSQLGLTAAEVGESSGTSRNRP
jgi:hypothetical protein